MNWGKKANLKEVVIYTLLALAVFSLAFIFIEWKGSQSAFYEQVYAKKIGLLIDKAKPGSEIDYDASELLIMADKNKFKGRIIKIDNNENKVKVQLIEGGGYDFVFFNNADIVWSLDNNMLKIKFIEKN